MNSLMKLLKNTHLKGLPFRYRLLYLVAYACLIFFLSSQSFQVSSHSIHIPHLDKVAHIILYAVFGCLTAFMLNTFCLKKKYFWGIALIIVGLYGLSDEIHQLFVHARNADIYDWIADMLGGGIGIIVFKKVVQK